MPNTGGTDKDTKHKSAKNNLENSAKCGYKCICLNARCIVNKIKREIDPHIVCITGSWANTNIYQMPN